MQLAISNIAWEEPEEKEIFGFLKDRGVKYIELAPSKVFQDAAQPSAREVDSYKEYLEANGLQPVSFQSLFYPRPELNVFFDTEASLAFMKDVVDLARDMGVTNLVFGSPKNRDIRDLTPGEARKRAIGFFRELGTYSAENDVFVCMEANATVYNCNFLTGTPETIAFIREVDSPGIQLNLDLGTVRINDERITDILDQGMDTVRHVHLSEPYLKQVKGDDLVRQTLSQLALRKYDRYVSIEMRRPEVDLPTAAVRESLDEVLSVMP